MSRYSGNAFIKFYPLSRSLNRIGLIFALPVLLGVTLAACSGKEPDLTVAPTNTPAIVQATVTRSRATPVPERPTSTPDRVVATTATPTPMKVTTPVRETVTPVAGAITIPIEVVDASRLGSLQFYITYDPRVLEFHSVGTGPLAREALLVSNLVAPGKLKVALVDASGINGDGIVITSLFRPLNLRGTTDLFAVVEEVSDTDLRELSVLVTPAMYTGPDDAHVPLTLRFKK